MKHARREEENLYRLTLWSSLFVIFLLLVCATISFGVTQAKAEEQRQAEAAKALEEEHRAWVASEALAHQRQIDQWANVREQMDILRKAEEQKKAEEEAVYQEWPQQQYYANMVPYFEPYVSDDGEWTVEEFQFAGVIEEDGRLYTYYSERILPGAGLTELNSNGRHVEDGFVKDGDGYIAVASSDEPMGTVVDTPFGQGKVYDTGYLQPGQVDIYVAF